MKTVLRDKLSKQMSKPSTNGQSDADERKSAPSKFRLRDLFLQTDPRDVST